MARIPEFELSRLKREVSLQELVASSGVKLERRGEDWVGLCPFHEDHDPSLVITPSKNLWHCLGACRTGGSVIDWVMKMESCSFRHAVEQLRRSRGPVPLPAGEGECWVLDPSLSDRELLLQYVDYCQGVLASSPEALGYLETRGLKSEELISHFRLGFANRTLGYGLPPKGTKAGKEFRDRLRDLGLLRETGHEHLNGRLLVPVFDREGGVSQIYGRTITPNLRTGTPDHLYLPRPLAGVFHREALAENTEKEVILCEALIDAMTFWAHGFKNVTSSFGVEGFTEDHLDAFREHGVERVFLAYDRDEAGDRAAGNLATKLLAQGIECFRVEFPRGMDANDYARRVKPAEASLGLLLRNATWLGRGTVRAVVAGGAPREGAAKEKAPATEEAAMELESQESLLLPLAASFSEAERSTPEPATPPTAPPSRAAATPADVVGDEVTVSFGDRRYRVRGLSKNPSPEALRVNVLLSRSEAMHVDSFDLYSARQRALFTKPASEELGIQEEIVKHDLSKLLLKLEELQDQTIRGTIEKREERVGVSDQDRLAALELLRDPNLLDRILADFSRCGVVGEETNKLVGYLAAVSRKLDRPLAVVLQSSSAAGKTSLMDSVLAFVPEEERVEYSAMTGQSLFYMSEKDLKHKVLALVEEEGAERASYALKLLQSEGRLSIASTGKDPQTGKLVTHEYQVEGPVAIFLTTTAIEIDEELLNRCFVLAVDENRDQTRAIHALQRERRTLAGFLRHEERSSILALHRNAQRLLEPLAVVNPYAPRLTFLDTQTRTRRDHEKYLTLIDTIALLHQRQRERKTVSTAAGSREYIEVELSDIATANRLAGEVLGHSLDELPPQTRRLLTVLDRAVGEASKGLEIPRSELRFTMRQAREWSGCGPTQTKVHLARLVDLEYVLVHRGGRGQSFIFELLYDGEGRDGAAFVPKLIEVDELRREERSGQTHDRSGSNRPRVGAESGDGRPLQDESKRREGKSLSESEVERDENALPGEGDHLVPSYRREARRAAKKRGGSPFPAEPLELGASRALEGEPGAPRDTELLFPLAAASSGRSSRA
jgi:DNA primase catalytic core